MQHGLTVHTTYEVISPYPKFQAAVCLNYANHIVVNTGNFLHVLKVDLDNIKVKSHRIPEKHENSTVNFEQLGVSIMTEAEDSKSEPNENCREDKALTLECGSVVSPKCDLNIADCEYNEEEQFRICDKVDSEQFLNTFSNNQNDCACDNKASINSIDKTFLCLSNLHCQCGKTGHPNPPNESRDISVRDKILQDFCEDMSQELSIGSDLVTLVKHSPCSPRATPQRLPPAPWLSPTPNPSDILKTRNSESSLRYSPQPGASPRSSPHHSFSRGTSAPSSPRLMSPPITKSLRYFKY